MHLSHQSENTTMHELQATYFADVYFLYNLSCNEYLDILVRYYVKQLNNKM